MKKISLISLLSFIIVAIVVSLWTTHEETEEQYITWEKFMTDPHSKSKIIITKPLPSDLVSLGEVKEKNKKKINSKKSKQQERNPSSFPQAAKNYETYKKREVIGTTHKDILKLPKINQPTKEWKEHLAKSLLRGREHDEVSVFIKKEKSFIRAERNGARYIEQVVVNIKKTDHGSTGYRAYIDSETGKVLQTWDRSVHEHGQFKKGHTFKLNL
ncbi:hypothetical protein OAT67_06670 [Bacteriovoracaceae bacterium]|nr:hypothetical protein [Bacteriovoracaceae bacterium]|tara:strand:- start:290214 stop:290855 length:642 start_codon:yes stop_codon:yes gene_type:complete